jgi:hypothetical protein
LSAERLLYRNHKSHRHPWHFSAADPERPRCFDLPHPDGTCYLAEEDLGAFVEALQGSGSAIALAEIAVRSLSRLSVPTVVSLADCTESAAAAFGVTAELHASPDRQLTQGWARAFMDAGFHGIRYFVRHDPAQRQVGIALFGRAGGAGWELRATDPISADLIVRVQATFGIRFIE